MTNTHGPSARTSLAILFITNSLDVGGVERNLVGLTAELRARAHEIWVASSGGVLQTDVERLGGRHFRAGVTLKNPLALMRAALAVRRLIRQERIDIVHAMSAAGNLATQLLPRSIPRTTAFLTSPMGLQNSERECQLVTGLRNLLLALRADRVLVISEEIWRALRDLPIDHRRMIRCDVNGVDVRRFEASTGFRDSVRRELGIGQEQWLVTTIGSLHPRKSHHLFLRAAVTVGRSLPNTRFLIVGEGPERGRLKAEADELELTDRVVFAGQRNDIEAILAGTDVYVKPGVVEGFVGITVLEAMAAGAPVVAFDTRDVRAAIEDGVTGLLAARGDVGALAAAIIRLLNNRDEAATMAAHARRFVADRFSVTAVASQLESAYAETLTSLRA